MLPPSPSFLSPWLFCVAATVAATVGVPAQGLEPSTDDELLELRIARQCASLRERGELRASQALLAQVEDLATFPMAPVAASTVHLPPVELCAALRRSVRIVGHYYLCQECDEWHFNGASGFLVGSDGLVATCEHVLAPEPEAREDFLVMANLDGTVWPVEKVVAKDRGGDLAVLQTAEKNGVPLPLAASVRQGERVFCLSNPDHQFGFFSEGLVARRYLQRDEVPEGVPRKPADQVAPRPWLHVTCEFAKGSSGAPIVDATGAVVGIAQSTTTVVYDETAELVDTQMVFKTATPSSVLAALLPTKKPAPAPAEPAGKR